MSLDFSIVRATEADFDIACEIIGAYQDSVQVVVRDDPAAIALYFRDPYGLWLALRDKQAVGCIALRPLPHLGGGAAEVKRLYVEPRWRGKGLADALLDALEAFAARKGFTRVYLDSKDDLQAALRFYQRRGYTEVESYNDNPQATIFMARHLDS